jgi:perosamine synthetase
MFVNHNGYASDARDEIAELCRAENILFIEDSAQAFGTERSAGKVGIFGVYSFSVPKLITTGQGGVVLTSNDELATKVRQLRDHGDNWRKEKIHNHIGLNLKFNDMAAALGESQINRILYILKTRERIFLNYRAHLKLVDFGYPSTWMVIYRTNKADAIISALKAHNIQAVKYYRPIPSNAPFILDPSKYTEAEYVYEHHLYLPSSLNLMTDEINEICNIIYKVENEKESLDIGT